MRTKNEIKQAVAILTRKADRLQSCTGRGIAGQHDRTTGIPEIRHGSCRRES